MSAVGREGSPAGAVWGGSHEAAGAGAGGRIAVYAEERSAFTGQIRVDSPADGHAGTARVGGVASGSRQVVSVMPLAGETGRRAFRLKFHDANVRADSVTGEDFVITAAAGVVPSAAVEVGSVEPGVFDVQFPWAAGDEGYRVLAGPGFLDLFGQPMEMRLRQERWLGVGKGAGGTFLMWLAGGGMEHRLEAVSALSEIPWQGVGEPVAGEGRLVLEVLGSAGEGQSFYRLRLGP